MGIFDAERGPPEKSLENTDLRHEEHLTKTYCNCGDDHLERSRHMAKPSLNVVTITCGVVKEWQTVLNVVTTIWSLADIQKNLL